MSKVIQLVPFQCRDHYLCSLRQHLVSMLRLAALWLIDQMILTRKINSENISNIEQLKLQIFFKLSCKHFVHLCSLPKSKISVSTWKATGVKSITTFRTILLLAYHKHTEPRRWYESITLFFWTDCFLIHSESASQRCPASLPTTGPLPSSHLHSGGPSVPDVITLTCLVWVWRQCIVKDIFQILQNEASKGKIL